MCLKQGDKNTFYIYEVLHALKLVTGDFKERPMYFFTGKLLFVINHLLINKLQQMQV